MIYRWAGGQRVDAGDVRETLTVGPGLQTQYEPRGLLDVRHVGCRKNSEPIDGLRLIDQISPLVIQALDFDHVECGRLRITPI